MSVGRNQPCPCGSGKKYKHCHANRPGDSTSARPAPNNRPRARIRECDGCTACCGPALRLNEPDVVVPLGEWCPAVGEAGCSRWKTSLPELCRDYTCEYLVTPLPVGRMERPDRVGAILQQRPGHGTLMAECEPGGLFRLLQNHIWGPLIQEVAADGTEPLVVSFANDPYGAETMRLKPRGKGLGCELACCDEDGKPILVPVEPVHEPPLFETLFLPGQNFTFDAEALIQYLGDRDAALLVSSRNGAMDSPVRFRITRRQAEFLAAALALTRPARTGAYA